MASRPVGVVRIQRVVQKGRCHYTGRIRSCILDNPRKKSAVSTTKKSASVQQPSGIVAIAKETAAYTRQTRRAVM